MLDLSNLTVGYSIRHPVLESISLHVDSGSIVTLLGKNGCGKSTLLRTAAGLLKALSGKVLLNGTNLSALSPVMRARHMAFLSQRDAVPGDMTVEMLISTGRFPFRRWHGFLTAEDKEAVEEAMNLAGLQSFRNCPINRLSGGERQKARLAAAFAQHPSILFLDEPTTFLDPAEQIRIMELVCSWNRSRKMTVIQVLHDVNLAMRCSDRILAFAQGRMIFDGSPERFGCKQILHDVFGITRGSVLPVQDEPPCWIPPLLHRPGCADSETIQKNQGGES